MFTERDLQQIKNRGISLQIIERQLANFKKGFPSVILHQPAIPGKGIRVMDDSEIKKYAALYREKAPGHKVIKFVPASGAASRMFKHLFTYLEESNQKETDQKLAGSASDFNSVQYLLDHIRDIAFCDALKEAMKAHGLSLDDCLEQHKYGEIIEHIIGVKGLNYGNLPKGLILFHRYSGASRTSIQEHLVEGAHYSKDSNNNIRLHFTLSREHISRFLEHVASVTPELKRQFSASFDIGYSIQKPATDMLAVDLNNEPFREDNGDLVFRPGGHGALIENLDDLQEEMIFIKNIDNVVPDHLKPQTYLFKEVLGGLLLEYQAHIFTFLEALEKEISTTEIEEIAAFAKNRLDLYIDPGFEHLTQNEQQVYLINKLNRPIRVCGMVKNQGEPGGGPFWLEHPGNGISLQIVESSQVDLENPVQKQIFGTSTHFNPVDLVCGVSDYRGKKFDLHRFVDPDTGFISLKSKDGRTLKAQELPGLWNGAMAGWITVFVEVPLITFNPVKIVNDLLRDTHQ